jgi:MurNAc alpha-1-phosphate uridylyltransferase
VSDLCAVVLAAGEGQRLRPLTARVPKALCPVGNVPLLDHALARVARLGFADPATVAVNASYLGDQVVAHVGGRAHVSPEDHPLGTSGGVAKLRTWIDGRGVLVGNADAYLAGDGADPVAASRCCPGAMYATSRPSPPSSYARSGGRPRRRARWRW